MKEESKKLKHNGNAKGKESAEASKKGNLSPDQGHLRGQISVEQIDHPNKPKNSTSSKVGPRASEIDNPVLNPSVKEPSSEPIKRLKKATKRRGSLVSESSKTPKKAKVPSHSLSGILLTVEEASTASATDFYYHHIEMYTRRVACTSFENQVLQSLEEAIKMPAVQMKLGLGKTHRIIGEIEGILRNERSQTEKVSRIITIAERYANTNKSLLLVLKILNAACSLAVKYFEQTEIATIFLRCTDTLQTCSSTLPSGIRFEEDISHKITLEITQLKNILSYIEDIDNNTFAETYSKYMICSSTLYFSIACYDNANEYCDNAIAALEAIFGSESNEMPLYARACLEKSLCCFCLKKQEVGDMFLEKSFDAFFEVVHSKGRATDIVDLYTIVANVKQPVRSINKTNLELNIFIKLQEKDQSNMEQFQKLFHCLALLLLSKLLHKNEAFSRFATALNDIEFPPVRPFMSPAKTLILHCIFCLVKGPSTGLSLKLFKFAKELGLLSKVEDKKIDFLNRLVVALGDYESHFTNFEKSCKELFSNLLCNIQLKELDVTCDWENYKLGLSLMHASYFYAVVGNYDKCLEELKTLSKIGKAFRGTYNESFEILKASAHYLAAYALLKKRYWASANKRIALAIKELEQLKVHCFHRLEHAQKLHNITIRICLAANAFEQSLIFYGCDPKLCKECTLSGIHFKRVYF